MFSQGWYMPSVTQLSRITMMLILSNHTLHLQPNGDDRIGSICTDITQTTEGSKDNGDQKEEKGTKRIWSRRELWFTPEDSDCFCSSEGEQTLQSQRLAPVAR
ncbi:hypothetical protein EYF80_032133 [Liparis tanakae]|uniref:Uncharacterized protein n=1 Tax=Liparis tanakae TaxID=230148 RepID=A0A4Z2GWK9_9TELE|nr:hypothetical protein EYF80_032133 [Liparis tanakae]